MKNPTTPEVISNENNNNQVDIGSTNVKKAIEENFNQESTMSKIEGKSSFLNAQGEEVITNYDHIGRFKEGFAVVHLGDKRGFIDNTGKVLVEPKYDYVENFHEGFAVVKLNGKKGFINTQGEEVIDLKYDNLRDFEEGFARVWLDGKCGIINTQGEVVIEVKYNESINIRREGSNIMATWGGSKYNPLYKRLLKKVEEKIEEAK